MKSNPFVRGVNVGHLGPVAEPFPAPGATEPAECPPACPACGGEALWFTDPDTTRAELVCLECAPSRAAHDLPEANGLKRSGLTTEELKQHARAYADEHFTGWSGIAIHIRTGDGGCGELLLVLTNSVLPRPKRL